MQRGHTLSELLVALAVAAMLACVSVPGIAWVDGRAAVSADARSLAFVLRRAQARAAMSGATVCVRLDRQGCGYVCEETADAVTTVLGRGDFHGPCATNYPGGAVEFCTAGWPCSLTGEPRAGTFTFESHGADAAVVLQMGGRVRWQ
jgi:prepilin-type N-terminal cleavage/methylation domain-containing protein